jgi:hypothetical protein
MFRNLRLVILPKTVGIDPLNSLKANARYSREVSCCIDDGMVPVIWFKDSSRDAEGRKIRNLDDVHAAARKHPTLVIGSTNLPKWPSFPISAGKLPCRSLSESKIAVTVLPG